MPNGVTCGSISRDLENLETLVARIDPYTAAAESELERLDDLVVDPDDDQRDPTDGEDPRGTFDPSQDGFHLDDPSTLDADDPSVPAIVEDPDLDTGLRDDAGADLLDALAEAYNARDLDALLEVVAADGEAPGLLGYDRANLPAAVEDLWERRPSTCLTRGSVDGGHVGVLWEYDGASWWALAVVHVADLREGTVGVVEFSDDGNLLDRVSVTVPDDDLDQGARWSEWEEGADGG